MITLPVTSGASVRLFGSFPFSPFSGRAASPISSSGISGLPSDVELFAIISDVEGRMTVVDEEDADADAGDPSALRGERLPMVFPLSTSNACKNRDTSHERDRPSQM